MGLYSNALERPLNAEDNEILHRNVGLTVQE